MPVSHVVNVQEKFLREVKSAVPVNTQIIRKPYNFITLDGESVSV